MLCNNMAFDFRVDIWDDTGDSIVEHVDLPCVSPRGLSREQKIIPGDSYLEIGGVCLAARLRRMYSRTPIRHPVQITKHIVTKQMCLLASKFAPTH